MSYSYTALDKLSVELSEQAKAYAEKAECLAQDPYFREAIVKVAVSSFACAFYDAFSEDAFALETLKNEMIEQSAAVQRSVDAANNPLEGDVK